jgi:Flp pilus assembly pilin Flp
VRLLRDEEGQDLVEYVLLISLVALTVALAFPPLTGAITQVFQRVQSGLSGPAAPPAGGG